MVKLFCVEAMGKLSCPVATILHTLQFVISFVLQPYNKAPLILQSVKQDITFRIEHTVFHKGFVFCHDRSLLSRHDFLLEIH